MSRPEQREEAVFEAALRLAADQRAAYLDQTCAGDPETRRRVEALLGAFERAGGFLKDPAVATPARTVAVSLPPTEKPGDKIGRYKLLEQIGEGGCGVVYVAEQEEPVRRRVALKVIKLGMDTKQVIARFDAERQALALMDHPNIAKIHDAGVTDTGRPYFIMELVRGIKITDYCDQNRLPPRERLDLFTQVCRAIQHAHQKGIIHRDIKPSNILVTLHDGIRVPKVIDFGIAKATQGRLTDQTVYTALEQFIGTPAYMSPEQAEMSGLDIDTRSDIYSLGVLLYELLTGKTPFDAKELLAAGLDEMRRTIREVEPVKPSTRLTQEFERTNGSKFPRSARNERGEGGGRGASDKTSADFKSASSPRPSPPSDGGEGDDRASSRRLLQTKELIHLLRGDLDWIVMKCLEKDRTRRYETANGLATDIRRHLENEPVVACPPSAAYRFQKMVRRNKLTFAALTAVAAALLIGLGIAAWQFIGKSKAYTRVVAAERQAEEYAKAEEAQRKQAEARRSEAILEASKSRQVAEFLKDMLRGVRPSVALGRDTTMLREILDKTVGHLSRELTNQPLVEAELQHTIGVVYSELGEFSKAESIHREELATRRKLLGNEHLEVALSLSGLAVALANQGRFAEAEKLVREALAIRKKRLGDEHVDVVWSLNSLATQLSGQGKNVEAEKIFRQVLEMRQKLGDDDMRDRAFTIENLGHLMMDRDPVEAEKMFREAIAIYKKLRGDANPDLDVTLDNLAVVLIRQRKFSEAEKIARESLNLKRNVLGVTHPHVMRSLYGLSEALDSQGKLEEGTAIFREHLAILENAQKTNSLPYADALNDLANRLAGQKKYDEAEAFGRQALEIQQRLASNNLPQIIATLGGLSALLDNAQRYSAAEPLLQQRLELQRRLHGNDDIMIADSLGWMAWVYVKDHKFTEVEHLLQERLAIQKKHFGSEQTNVLETLERLATNLEDQGKWSQSETLRKELLAAGRKVLGKDHPQTLEAAVKLSSLFINEDKRTEAQALNQELAALTLEDSKAGSALTEILSRMGRWDEAAANCSLLINANPDDVMAWFKRGEIFGRTGRWKEAAADLAHAVRLKPTDNFASRILAPVLIANRDLKSYRQLCQHMLTQFADTKDIGTADTVAKNCLLLPSTEVDSNAVAKLADVAVMLGSQSEYFPWFELCKGLAEYRQEHFDGAAEWSQKALTKQSQPLERDACAYLVLAMAQMKAGRHSAARVAFRTGAEIVEKKLPNLNSDDLGVQWVDVIIANILMREAKALIEGQPATATEKKTESP